MLKFPANPQFNPAVLLHIRASQNVLQLGVMSSNRTEEAEEEYYVYYGPSFFLSIPGAPFNGPIKSYGDAAINWVSPGTGRRNTPTVAGQMPLSAALDDIVGHDVTSA